MKCMKCGYMLKQPQDDIMIIGVSVDGKIRAEAISSATCLKCKAEHHTRWIVEKTWVVDDLYKSAAPPSSSTDKGSQITEAE